MLLLFHIPYFFFSVKEYFLVVYDEISNRSLSTHLEQRLAGFLKMNEEKEEEQESLLKKKELVYKKVVKSPAAAGQGDHFFQSVETDNLIEKSD